MSNPNRPFGWRKRIGLLSPTVIETAAYDFYRLAPDGVSMCATPSNIEHWSRENFQQHVLDPIVSAVRYLASRHVDYIIHTGMPVVTTRGKGFEDELVKQIEDVTGLPATTSIRSAIRALAHLGVRDVAVVTPYPKELHQSALSFLGASGFRVVAEHTMDVVFKQLQDVTPAQIAATARRVIPLPALALLVTLPTLGLGPLASAPAQDFPSRPVRFVVPYAAGGSGDMLARLLGNKLANIWGQQVVVDNRAGAGGLIGTEFAARSEPDGYTLYLATDGPLTVAASLYKRVPYDWKRDFAPVSMLAMGYQVLIVSPSLPARNLQELIALARQKPGELNYASIGIGSAPHLGAELFKSVAKVDITHVPYRGSSAQAIAALIARDDSMFLVGTT